MSRRRTDYFRGADGAILRAPPGHKLAKGEAWAEAPHALDADALRARAKHQVDAAAEAARRRFLTPGAGQALVYEAKRREAKRWLEIVSGGGEPDPAEFPLLQGRTDRLGIDPQAVAKEWNTKAQNWIAVAAAIEGVRETAKEAIDEAGDGSDLAERLWAIVGELAWPGPQDVTREGIVDGQS